MGEKPPAPDDAARAAAGSAATAGESDTAAESGARSRRPGRKFRREERARRSQQAGQSGAHAGSPVDSASPGNSNPGGGRAGLTPPWGRSEDVHADEARDTPPSGRDEQPSGAALQGTAAVQRLGAPQELAALDEQALARLAALFDSGRDLPPRLREGWLLSVDDADPQIVSLLRVLLARADDPDLAGRGPQGAAGAARGAMADTAGQVAPEDHAPEDPAPALTPFEPAAAQPSPAVESPGEAGALASDEAATRHSAERTDEGGTEGAAKPEPAFGSAEEPAGESAPAAELDEPRLMAPTLSTGMRLGPWQLLGPMTASDARVQQWRARGADGTATGQELALLVPHQWRARPQLAAWLAHAARGPLSLVHPHIARLVDVGVTDEGVPWLAAELAEGQPIDRWLRDHASSLHERRELFDQALEAAAFAHGQLVLHGQIHPSQIVVLPNAQVRWLNFGLDELLQLLGTPAVAPAATSAPPARAYVAPELAGDGVRASIAGDVHALGLVLFEVLGGVSPWQPRAAGRAVVPADDPSRWPRPSDVVSTPKLRRALAGDHDAIVAKATATAPEARYASVAALRDDLRRAGQSRPVSARAGGLPYEVGCAVRRHPAITSALAVLAVVLGLGAVGLAWKAWTWTQERESALAAQRNGEAVTRLLQEVLRDAAQPGAEHDWPGLLARAEAVARSSLKAQPAGLAAALALIGRHHAERGAFAEARNLLAEAMPQLTSAVERQEATCDDAWAQARQGDKVEEAMQRLRRIAENAAVRPLTRVVCVARLADLDRRTGRNLDAYLGTYEAWRLWDGTKEKPAQLALLLSRPMGQQAAVLGRFHESQLWFEWMLEHATALRQENSLLGLELREQWGEVSLAAGDAQQALKLADANLAAVSGSEWPADAAADTAPPAQMIYAAAEPRVELHRLAEARVRIDRVIALAEARGDATMGLRARCLMGLTALRERDIDGAQRWLKGLPTETTPTGAGAPAGRSASVRALLPGATLHDLEREAAQASAAEAEQFCRAVQLELALLQGRHTDVQRESDRLLTSAVELTPRIAATVMRLRAESLLALKQPERALSAALQALQKARSLHQSDVDALKAPPSFRSGQAALVLAEAYRANGDLDNAGKTLAYAQQQLTATLPEPHPWRRRAEVVKSDLTDPATQGQKKP